MFKIISPANPCELGGTWATVYSRYRPKSGVSQRPA